MAELTTLPTIDDPRIYAQWTREWPLKERLIAWCYVGSVQHGTHGEVIDDVDLFALVQPPRSLWPFEHWVLQHEELDVLVYSWAKYLRLLAKGNPNMIATLDPEVGLWGHTPLRSELLAAVQSKGVLRHALGYAQGQYAKLLKGKYEGYMGEDRKRLFDQYGYDPKAASHAIRILRFALDFAEGTVRTRRDDAPLLREIKRGGWSVQQIGEEYRRLEHALEVALEWCDWPDHPDTDALDRIYRRGPV